MHQEVTQEVEGGRWVAVTPCILCLSATDVILLKATKQGEVMGYLCRRVTRLEEDKEGAVCTMRDGETCSKSKGFVKTTATQRTHYDVNHLSYGL